MYSLYNPYSIYFGMAVGLGLPTLMPILSQLAVLGLYDRLAVPKLVLVQDFVVDRPQRLPFHLPYWVAKNTGNVEAEPAMRSCHAKLPHFFSTRSFMGLVPL